MNGSQSKAKAFISTRWMKVKMGVAELGRDIDVLNRRLGETRPEGGEVLKMIGLKYKGRWKLAASGKPGKGPWR